MRCRLLFPGYFILMVFIGWHTAAFASEPPGKRASMTVERVEKTQKPLPPVAYPIIFFQKYLSGADSDRCPMHPSCSNYCIHAMRKHGALLGWIMTCDRLIRCGRDELKKSPALRVKKKLRCFDPVENNDFWWHR